MLSSFLLHHMHGNDQHELSPIVNYYGVVKIIFNVSLVRQNSFMDAACKDCHYLLSL